LNFLPIIVYGLDENSVLGDGQVIEAVLSLSVPVSPVVWVGRSL